MPLNTASHRPVHLNLFRIRLPVAGVMSIIHRLTGVVMFLAIPLFVYLLDRSLISEAGFREAVELLHTPLGILALFGLMWSLMHHFLAGIRYLLIDLDMGVDRPTARVTALLVIVAGPLAGLLLTWGLL